MKHYRDAHVTQESSAALNNLKVIDLSVGYAGSYCTKILRDLGATVIKVESPETGDVTRQYGPFLTTNQILKPVPHSST